MAAMLLGEPTLERRETALLWGLITPPVPTVQLPTPGASGANHCQDPRVEEPVGQSGLAVPVDTGY